MKRTIICVAVFMTIFACTGMVRAPAQAYDGEEGNIEPTVLSSKPLQEPYVQALAAAGADQNGYNITVTPNASGFPDITLTLSVLDENGYSVGGLTADDFSVFEQSTTETAATAQELTCFRENVSNILSGISFAIAIDVSDSMTGSRLAEAKEAAKEFIANSSETDRGSLISFSTGGREKIILPANLVNTDSDGDGALDIVEAIDGLTASGMTALFDGTALAIESLAQEPNPKAVIVFSDGVTNSDRTYDINALIEKANNEAVMIFPIALGNKSTILENIAQLTGGTFFYAPTAQDMTEVYDIITNSIQGVYTYDMCYTTHNPALDGTTRTVTVEFESGSGMGFYTVNYEQTIAHAGSDITVGEGDSVTLDGTGSAGPNIGDILTYEWTQAEGIPVELTNASEQQSSFIAPNVGPEGASLAFVLTVMHAVAVESTDTVTIFVMDSIPEAAFSWSPENPTVGETVSFTDMSIASGDEIVSRVWEFGGEGADEGVAPSYAFGEPGDYSVTLTVTDSDGSTDTITRSISIEGCPNGNCDPGGGCFISELIPQGDNRAMGMHIPFVALCFAVFGTVIIIMRRKRPARGRRNSVRFTLFIGMVLTVILMAVSPNVQAEEKGEAFVRPGAFTVSPMVGGYMFDASQDIEEGPVFGLGLGYNFTENWAVRLYGHFGQFNHPYWDSYTCGCVEEDVDASVLQGDLVYHLWPGSRFVPYLAAGAGYIDLDFDNTGTDSSATLNYGGGIKYFLTRNLALKANVRHVFWLENSKSNMIANVGLEFQFGGSKKKPAIVPPVPEPEPPAAPVEKPPKPEPKSIPPIVKPEPEILVLKINFKFDSAKIDPSYHDEIEKAVQFLNEHTESGATIEGHTCNIGTEAYNMGLSRRRAESVKNYMVKNFNVDGARLSTIGYGESRPDHDNATLEGRRLNRRVIIRLEEE